MSVFLFHDVIFGPVRSRRLGLSLGINLLPNHAKYCSFNCIYCECGWTTDVPGDPVELPTREQVRNFLEEKLKKMQEEDYLPDAITYAGNGEPTLHPDFPKIVEDTILLRDRYAPEAKVTVLSNASRLGDKEVFQALMKLDNNIQKLDCGSEELFRLINNPVDPDRFVQMIGQLQQFNGEVIIQSLFLKGKIGNQTVDNTTAAEIAEWLKLIQQIGPKKVMIYSLDRATPSQDLEKIPVKELEVIAAQVRKLNIEAVVY